MHIAVGAYYMLLEHCAFSSKHAPEVLFCSWSSVFFEYAREAHSTLILSQWA